MKYIRLRFENDIGELIFDGEHLRILALEGLGTPQKTYDTIEYIGYDGVFTTNSKKTSRTINIKFDVVTLNLRHVMRVLDSGGTLYVQCGSVRRKITVNQITVGEPEPHEIVSTVTAQFICDNPYFNDWKENEVACYSVTKNIKYSSGSWNLSDKVVWGSLISDGIITNDSDSKIEPVFEIRIVGTTENGGGFEILRVNDNYSTDDTNDDNIIQRLSFNYDTVDGEVITVNLDGRNEKGYRYAVSDKNGSILNYRSDDTSLSKFWLKIGKNRIVVKNSNADSKLNVTMRYNNKYTEAVYYEPDNTGLQLKCTCVHR